MSGLDKGGWFVTQGCYVSHLTPIAKPMPGQPIQALGPSCSVPVKELMLGTFGPNFYTGLRAVMMSCMGIFLVILVVQASRLTVTLKKKGLKSTQLLHDPQFSMYFGWILSCISMMFWFMDPYESIGLYGKVGGRLLLAVMLFLIFSTIMWMMYTTWNGVLEGLGILKLPNNFMRYFFVGITGIMTFCALPLNGSLLYGLQFFLIAIVQVFFSFLNSYLGWLAWKQYRTSVQNLKSQLPSRKTSIGKGESDTNLKIILVAFGISSSTFGAFLASCSLPITLFIDAASGTDLQKALVQSSDFIVWRLFIIILGVSMGAVTAVAYFLYSFRNVTRRL